MSFYVSTATFLLLHCDEWDRVVALPRHKFSPRSYIIAARGCGRFMVQLFILSYSDAVSFRDIRGHLGTIPSIVTFYICACRRRALGD